MIDTAIESTIPRARPRRYRFWLLYAGMVLAMGVLAMRSFYLQAWAGNKLLATSEGNHVEMTPLTPSRGILYDSTGKQLVENIASTDIVFDPTLLPPNESESVLLEQLPTLLHIPPEQIQAALATARSSQRLTVIEKAVPHEMVLSVEEALPQLPGVRLLSSSVRKYFYGSEIGHVIGYTGAVSPEEMAQGGNFLSTDTSGKSGIEKQYDQLLRGTPGAIHTEVNASGRAQNDLGQQDPIAGANVTLTIDAELQKFIYGALDARAQEKPDKIGPGAAIVMDVHTGAIRAMVSYPSFDPNIFSQPSLHDALPDLLKQAGQPLFNRATEGMYPPGSTIKPFLAAAALQEKIITPDSTVDSTGGVVIGQYRFPDWKVGGHGITNVVKALAQSVNTFFYLATGGDGEHPGLGVQRATNYLRLFGFASASNIDLPSEATGFLPSPEWKQQTQHEPWYIGDTYHLGIGQGYVLATPLQIVRGTASVANGGDMLQPYLVDHYQTADGKTVITAVSKKHVPVDAANLAVVQQGMREAILSGSARSLSTLPITLAGKTGTAQTGKPGESHAWFTSFGPYESPKYAVTVLLEKGGDGDVEAVPIARQIWQYLYDHPL